jgi:ornithine decarboxylase
MKPHFTLSKSKLLEQVKKLEDLNLKISYSYKTNREIGKVLQEITPQVNFSIHAKEEIKDIKDKLKISFFTQAESIEELKEILTTGIKKFVIDNEVDLQRILETIKLTQTKINLSLRMKFQEHRIGTGKYFVYGLPSNKVNKIIQEIKDNPLIDKLGIHLHRKSQNTSEWEIVEEIKDSLAEETFERINMINLGGGLPSTYRSSNVDVFEYVFQKLTKAQKYLAEKNIETIIEPGRFLAAPPVELVTEIIQTYNNNLIINTTIYNCALDNSLTNTKMLVVGEQEKGEAYLIKGNSPTRDDIFRYKVYLDNPKVGDTITFLNAGAYNYTTDFFGYKKLETKITQ